ncbi:MAG: dienelactone hydrolase family protein [Pyrinomonadaceae bacterium]
MKSDRDEHGNAGGRHDASRRQFLQRAATGAGLAAATAIQTVAQTPTPSPAARPGAPLKGIDVKFTSGDLTIPAYLSRPPKKKQAPGVLVIHEVFGLNDHIRNVADRIAAAGYVALAPQFFARAASPPAQNDTDMQAIRRAAAAVKTEDAIKDMQAALDFLKADKGVKKTKLASIGFCMGGGWSYQLATHTHDLAGACIFYGRTPVELVPEVSCPILASFGGKDTGLMPTEPAWEEGMRKAGKQLDAKVYPEAGHGFFNDTRPTAYNAAAAADAWQRVLKFFRERLGE